VVRPLFVTLAVVAPALGSRCLGLIDRNKASWRAIMDAGAGA
jgi:hypothetical protein